MFQLLRHGMEHQHTVSPLWHGFLLEDLSVLHAFTYEARACEKKRREPEGENVSRFFVPMYLTYRVRLAAGFGSDVEVNVPVDTVRKRKNERTHGQANVRKTGRTI
jgi:hypothetical protein